MLWTARGTATAILALMSLELSRTVCLVTGASRGIGAATAVKLARLGADVVLNYRSKAGRAEQVARSISAAGGTALAMQADLTVTSELVAMMETIRRRFGRLDIVVLNASGGLEKGKAQDYAMALNFTAQLQTAQRAAELMPNGGRIVFVTSHWAHFYGQKPVLAGYEVVAKSKHAGERALREYAGTLAARGISLVIVSGDAIEGTITPRLLERQNPGMLERRRGETEALPTVDEFADAIAEAATDKLLPSGHTVFVGLTKY